MPSLVKAAARLSAIPLLDRLLRATERVIAPLQRTIALAGFALSARHAAADVRLRRRRDVPRGATMTTHFAWLGAARRDLRRVLAAGLRRLAREGSPAAVRGTVPRGHRPDRPRAARRSCLHHGTGDGGRRGGAADGGRIPAVLRRTELRTAAARSAARLRGRLPLLDVRFFVTAVLTQREAGGNLAEVLDNLASVIRDRFKVKPAGASSPRTRGCMDGFSSASRRRWPSCCRFSRPDTSPR